MRAGQMNFDNWSFLSTEIQMYYLSVNHLLKDYTSEPISFDNWTTELLSSVVLEYNWSLDIWSFDNWTFDIWTSQPMNFWQLNN